MASFFKHHDSMRLFIEVAKHDSLSAAANALNMTKGAISYQIATLEGQLRFRVFDRRPRGVTLTTKGQELLDFNAARYGDIERQIATLRADQSRTLTVGMSSYFAARCLSPRLMTFMQSHPDVQLRIQPMTQLLDLEGQGVDLAIRWGDGNWTDAAITPFLSMPAWAVGNADVAKAVIDKGLDQAFEDVTLLRDHDHSHAWSKFFALAGLAEQRRTDTLIIPDPNVRVQAVIDGQGVALMDELVAAEVEKDLLFRLSDFELGTYGYFIAQPDHSRANPSVADFVTWLRNG